MGALDDDEDGQVYQQCWGVAVFLQFLQPILAYTLKKLREVLHPKSRRSPRVSLKVPGIPPVWRQELRRTASPTLQTLKATSSKAIHVVIPQVE